MCINKLLQCHKHTHNIEGFKPEWCITTIYHAWDTPFWSGTLDIQGKTMFTYLKHVQITQDLAKQDLNITKHIQSVPASYLEFIPTLSFFSFFSEGAWIVQWQAWLVQWQAQSEQRAEHNMSFQQPVTAWSSQVYAHRIFSTSTCTIYSNSRFAILIKKTLKPTYLQAHTSLNAVTTSSTTFRWQYFTWFSKQSDTLMVMIIYDNSCLNTSRLLTLIINCWGFKSDCTADLSWSK